MQAEIMNVIGGRERDSSKNETFDALRSRIRDRFDDLSPHLQRIARTALDQPNFIALNTVVSIAEVAQVQPSTLIRFSKEFGYGGFSDLQKVFRLRLIEGTIDNREQVYVEQAEVDHPVDMQSILNGCVEALTRSLESARANLDAEDLAQAVAMIRRAPYVYVAGLRRSRTITSYLAYGLSRSEKRCHLLDFGGGMADQQIANMGPGDLLICVGFRPYVPAVVDLVRDANLRGRSILAITDTPESPFARNATLHFCVDNEVTGQFMPVSGAIALVQTLVVGLSESRTSPT